MDGQPDLPEAIPPYLFCWTEVSLSFQRSYTLSRDRVFVTWKSEKIVFISSLLHIVLLSLSTSYLTGPFSAHFITHYIHQLNVTPGAELKDS